jgi:uncharacterized protein
MNYPMLIVLDTNVLVSSLLKRNSIPGQILDAILSGKFQVVLDKRIVAEYSHVLHRPHLHISSEQADPILRYLGQSGFWIESYSLNIPLNKIIDPGDLPFAEAAIGSHAKVLVTGNKKHFTFLIDYPVKVLLPQEFISAYKHHF